MSSEDLFLVFQGISPPKTPRRLDVKSHFYDDFRTSKNSLRSPVKEEMRNTKSQITEAIDCLCKHKFFREAWAICKLRKAVDDPIHDQVASEWAQYLESVGNLEGAALVWTAAKKYKNGVAVLSKRKEITEDIQGAIDALNAKMQNSAE